MNTKKLLNAFDRWAAEGRPLALATVIETEGSTYSKPGAQMLITDDGVFQGMLSGGCLEGDLAERAAAVMAAGTPQIVTYDLGQNDDHLWGLGVGCDGLMRIFVQPLTKSGNYQPFTTMAAAFSGDERQSVLIVLESGNTDLPVGRSCILQDGNVVWTDIEDRFLQKLTGIGAQSAIAEIRTSGFDVRVFNTTIAPPPSILLLGAGLDAEPVVRLFDELGWRVTVNDHRPAYVEAGDFSRAEQVHCLPAAEVGSRIDFNRYAAVVVMSHHLETDRVYLESLSSSKVPYIGLLGPPDRHKRLLEELGDVSDRLRSRVHGPVGIDIGARGPAPIALSIVAEVYQFLMHS